MSDRGSGFGSFLLGIAVGAVVGFLFAPEAGDDTRRKLSKRLRNLRDAAGEKVDEVRGLLESAGDEEEDGRVDEDGDEDDEEAVSTRERLRRRLDAARRRRRRGREAPAQVEEEDEPRA
jgi:gas vesicle protein